eukprot:SAG11_NODE_586_length_8341_cov_33.741204_10_plen_76_part_00
MKSATNRQKTCIFLDIKSLFGTNPGTAISAGRASIAWMIHVVNLVSQLQILNLVHVHVQLYQIDCIFDRTSIFRL